VVVHSCNPSTWEAEAGESRVQGQPGPQKKKKERKKFLGVSEEEPIFVSPLL
jgi:hypothetical protein